MKTELRIAGLVYVAGVLVAIGAIQPWSGAWTSADQDNRKRAWAYVAAWPWALYKELTK